MKRLPWRPPPETACYPRSLTAPAARNNATDSAKRKPRRKAGGVGVHVCVRLGGSHAVIHLELDRMRRVLELVHFLVLEIDVGLDEVLGEHVALQQEGVVGLEALERLAQ